MSCITLFAIHRYPPGSCGMFCNQHTYDCYMKEVRSALRISNALHLDQLRAQVHSACCDEGGANCNSASRVPKTCPVGCGGYNLM